MVQDARNMSAEQVNEGLRDRNVDIFRQLYTTYSEELFLLAFRWVKDESLAKDLVHNLFVRLWDKAGMLTITGNVRHYFYRSITNMAINELKRQSRHVSDDILQFHPDNTSLQETSDHILLQKEIIRLVQELAPRCREIFLLSRMNGLEPAEIAARLGITLNTVYFQLAVALKFLRSRLPLKKN